MITVLIGDADLTSGRLELDGDAYRHLFRARRLASGTRLRVTDGAGAARWALVSQVLPDRAVLDLAEAAPGNEPILHLELLVATLRSQRASWLVEKATELGVAAIRFFNCSRAPRSYGAGTLERLRRVAAAALEQSNGSHLPVVSGVYAWADLLERVGGGGTIWVLDPAAAVAELTAPGARSVGVLVGPEGGWSDEERQQLVAAGGRAVGLGPRTLRVETAALAAASRLLAPAAAVAATSLGPGVNS